MERQTLNNTLNVLRRAYKIIRRDPNMASQADFAEEEIKNKERAKRLKEEDAKKTSLKEKIQSQVGSLFS